MKYRTTMVTWTIIVFIGSFIFIPGQNYSQDTQPLRTIMSRLMMRMAEVNQGIWLEDYSTISEASGRIANHPRVPDSQREQIKKRLGEDFTGFVRYDKIVHQHADSMKSAAQSEKMRDVLHHYIFVQHGCVGCHSDYREPLQKQ